MLQESNASHLQPVGATVQRSTSCVTGDAASAGRLQPVSRFVEIKEGSEEWAHFQPALDIAENTFNDQETAAITEQSEDRVPMSDQFPAASIRIQTPFKTKLLLSAELQQGGTRMVYVVLDRAYASGAWCKPEYHMQGWLTIENGAVPRMMSSDSSIHDCDKGEKDSSPLGLFGNNLKMYVLLKDNFYEYGGYRLVEVQTSGAFKELVKIGTDGTSYIKTTFKLGK